MPEIDIDHRALAEARQATRWYARRSQQAAAKFVLSLELALEKITDQPQSWPDYLHGTRAFGLRRFPYLIIYLTESNRIRIVAIAHGHRRPGYWRKRL